MLGNVSLHRIDREQALAAMGYRVAPWARGQGVATGALTALAGWAFERLGLARLEICHAIANPGSCRVAEKAGFQLEGMLRASFVYGDGERYDEHFHGRLRTDPAPML
jgi:RimJ/RimL family protein N-acetyltransferase